jgi:hypothetical protein
MSTTRILLFLLCFGFTGCIGLFNRHLLAHERHDKSFGGKPMLNITDSLAVCRQKLVNIALGEVGLRERTGNNDGARVEEYLAAVKLKSRNPYCAAFLSWVYMQEGFAKPRSGWSPDLVPLSRLTHQYLPANIVGFYYPELGRVAHVGMIETVQHHWAVTIEGNTNVSGSREGEGIYRKRRHLKSVYRMADWIVPERRKP